MPHEAIIPASELPNVQRTISRRLFVMTSTATALATAIGVERLAVAQEPHPKPTASNGPPPCDGPCPVYPFVIVRRDPSDTGSRSLDANDHSLGVDSQNIWFEDIATGQSTAQLSPGNDYRIFAAVSNLGSGPAFTLCVEFLVWTSTVNKGGTTLHQYDIVSTQSGVGLMPGESRTFQSGPWSPGFGFGLKPGDVIVRAYDPWSDHYTETGSFLYVNRDRHLGHRAYS